MKKEKGRNGKENNKRRSKLRQKDHDGNRKTTCLERGKNIIFRRGWGVINIVFGPKYRPLKLTDTLFLQKQD
jgi:hypothetical protein